MVKTEFYGNVSHWHTFEHIFGNLSSIFLLE